MFSKRVILTVYFPLACVVAAGYAWLPAVEYTLLLIGLGFLLGGAELMVRGAVVVATRAGISMLLIGLTVVAFGTSAPELAVGIESALRGAPDVNIGNVVGSNIANIGLILGLTAVVMPIACRRQIVRRELPIMLGISALGVLVMFGGGISRLEGVVLTAGLVLFVSRSYLAFRREGLGDEAVSERLEKEFGTGPEPARGWWGSWWAGLLFLAGGLAGLVVGSGMLVENAEKIALGLGVPAVLIGLTMVAVGTSLPELATCVVAALRGEPDMVLGNVLGSNIFNVLCVLGVTSLVSPVPVAPVVLARDVWVMLGFGLVCVPLMWTGGRVTRLEGAGLFGAYAAYWAVLVMMGGSGPGGG